MSLDKNVRVFKVTVKCASCGKDFAIYRMEYQKGRSPTNCSLACIQKSYQERLKTTREVVEFDQVPPEWQKVLLKKAKKFKFVISVPQEQ